MKPNTTTESTESWNVRRAKKLEAQRWAYIRAIIAQVSDVNRPDLEVHVEEYANRCKTNSVEKFVIAVRRMDAILGLDFRAIDAAGARRLLAGLRAHYSERAVRPMAILARQHIRWLFGVERLDEQGSACKEGKAVERALRVPKLKMKVASQVISPENQDRLIAALPVRTSLNPRFPMEVRDRWCLRGLKAAGDRISKFAALRLRDIRFDRVPVKIQGRTVVVEVAWLAVDFDAPDLKSTVDSVTNGVRFMWQHLEDLIAWLQVHPCVGIQDPDFDWYAFNGARHAADPDAPLNLRANCRRIAGIAPDAIAKIITLASEASGLDKELPAKLTPHDFRHTGATEDARNGDNEFDLRMKYDWGEDSKMPGYYVHMDINDARRRAAEKKAHLAAEAVTTSSPAVDALVALVRQAASQMASPSAGTLAPSVAGSGPVPVPG